MTVLALALAGCASESTPTSTDPDATDGSDGATGDGDVMAGPDVAEVPVGPPARVPTRMTVEQIARSIPVITGGIEWIEDFGAGPTNMLEILSGTLGAPDYLLVTQETLEPTLIVAKFMQDAADRLCPRWVEQDRAAHVDERTLVRHEAWDATDAGLIRANLRRLLLRAHGRDVDDASPVLASYERLFQAASGASPAGFEARDGWLAVCLGLFTDPAFLVY